MRRWSFSFIVFVGCLTVGLNLFQMTRSTGLLSPFPKGMPYCTVANNAEAFHNTEIRVRAQVFFHNSGMYVYEDCDDVEALMSSVSFGSQDFADLNSIETVAVANTYTRPMTATALIEGTFDAHASPGCWTPKFRIQATKIELLSPVTEYRTDSGGDGLRKKH